MNQDIKTNTDMKRRNNLQKDGDGYKIAVKRRKGVPKSINKDISYGKRYNGCEDTSLAKAITKFEKTHRRVANIDDVVNIFRSLQTEEPHAEVTLCTYDNKLQTNYYYKLHREIYTYDDDALQIDDNIFYKHTRRTIKIIKKNEMTFEEIIKEHKFLLERDQHNKMLSKFEAPQSLVFNKFRDEKYSHITFDDEYNYMKHMVEVLIDTQVQSLEYSKDSNLTSKVLGDSDKENCDFNFSNQWSKIWSEIRPVIDQIKILSPKCDQYIDVIEDLIFIAYVIIYCDDPNIMLGILITIYKKHSKGSLSKQIYDFISEICLNKSEEVPQSMEFRQYATKLLQLQNSVLFSKIKDGLALCIALGFLDPININVKNIRIFSCAATNLGNSCNDFISYVIDLLLYFFETGYQIFLGNFERIFDMNELSKIDDDLIHLNTYITNIQLGSYEMTTGHTIEDYYDRLSRTIESLKILSNTIKDKTYKSFILNKLTNAYKLLVTFDQSKPLAGLRESPFSLCFFGGSSVGKSSAAKMVLTSILSANKKSCKDEHICVIQPTDKFYSTYKANVTGVIIDDLCNTRSEKAVVDPAQLLISIVNNIPYYAPKSESSEKGKINVRPAVVVATTNTQHLEAHIWSNEPISVVRRLKYHITVYVRDEYKTNMGLDSSKVTDEQLEMLHKTGLQDLWLFDVSFIDRYQTDNVEKYRFKMVEFENKLLTRIDIFELIRFLNVKSKQHFLEQKKFVDGCKDCGLRHVTCELCNYPKFKCSCVDPDDSVQGGVFSLFDDFCTYVGNNIAKYLISTWNTALPSTLEKSLCLPLIKLAVIKYMERSYLNLINYIPYSIRETEAYKCTHYFLRRKQLYRSVFLLSCPIVGMTAYYTNFRNRNSIISWAAFSGFSTIIIYRWNYTIIMDELKTAPLNVVVPFIQSHQAIVTVFKVGVSVGTAIMALKIFKSMYVALRQNFVTYSNIDNVNDTIDNEIHGNLNPKSYDDILNRDKEVNIWNKNVEKFIPNINTSTMTIEQLINVVKSNILNVILEMDDYNGVSIGCIALKSNIFCCPLHFFKEDKNIYGNWRPSNVRPSNSSTKSLYKLKFVKHDGESGNSFSATIDYKDIVQICDLDLCIFRVSSGGSFPDILKFCVFNNYDVNTRTIRRTRSGNILLGSARAVYTDTSYIIPGNNIFKKTFKIQGGRAYYDNATSCGDCMMMHIRETKDPSIIGFHISGCMGTTMGSYTMFTKEQITLALQKLEKVHDVFTPHSGTFMNLNRLGTIIKIQDDIPDKAPVNYIRDHNYIIRGTIDTQVSYFTEIRNTYMCSKVEKIFGVDNIWGGPKFGPQRWKPWYTFLNSSNSNFNYMDSVYLKLAKQDYIKPLEELLPKYDEKEKIRPLTHHEIINGIPGKRFIDHINFKSSIGYPLRGKKIKYMQGSPTNYDFNTDIFEVEYDKMKECYLKGERYYPIFKASLKDEPTKLTKDKVRVFQAADITLQYGWRKYGLPILRFLSLHPIISECAVGINPYNDEWHQVHMHLTFNGTHNDRIIAGDYKSWDQKLPAELVLAAFDIIIRLATLIPSYNNDDIMIIRGLATDTTYYLSHFNGTLIEFNNGLPSGHNLTAHINSIANSILLRYGYFLNKNPLPFRKYCHAITYGDDFECGTHKSIKNFDHLIYKNIVESVGMILTMPDKISEPVPFLHIDECDFLKRRSVKCDIDNKYYGALDYMSMLRSLMVRGKTSVSDKDHAYSVIRGFVHDLSFHTRITYDNNIIKIRELLSLLSLIMPEAHKSYDEYYHFRNGDNIYEFDYELDVLDNATSPVGYPMTPEASGDSEQISYFVSSSENSSMDECNMGLGNTLTETIFDDSYLSTKVLDGNEPRRVHDDCIQSEVFGQSEDNLNSNVTIEGTAVLTSAAEHSKQDLSLTSQDTLSLRQDATRSLAQYLSRPRTIMRINPAIETSEITIAPLIAFLGAPLIRDKIRNYAYINGVLHIKVVVVGSPTMAGSHLIALHPWWSRDNGLGLLNFGNPRPDLTQLSQLPSVLTDLSREKGGEISMPIICPSNGLDITDNDQIAEAFGLHYMTVTPTLLPVGSRTRPQIIVYCWLTDVELTGTTLRSELPQADEYHRKPHEIPSSDHVSIKDAVSKAGGKIIGKATEIGISKAMSAMGFSNPNRPEEPYPNIPKLASNMSTYNAPVNIDSLAGDNKNEVSLSSKLLGFEDADHMDLNNILTRWSILNTIQITTGVIEGTIESFNLPVTPMAARVTVEQSTTIFTPTALSMAALPFNRWRGTITYRFQAVGTAFMKGKIKISHDVKTPTAIQEFQKTDTQLLNTVIWDLATTNTIEVKVPWASNQAFKQCGLLRQSAWPYGTLNTTPDDPDANGNLILNPYTTINDQENGSIYIIVSIKGEPGMVFGDMRAVLANYTFAGIQNTFNDNIPQSEEYINIPYEDIDYTRSCEHIIYFKDGRYLMINYEIWVKYFANKFLDNQTSLNNNETPQSLVYDNDLNKNILTGDNPGSIMCVNINGLEDNLDDHDELVMTCMGEKFYSIRQIIKRYTQNWTRNYTNDALITKYLRIRLPDRPLLKGWQGNASVNIQPNNIRVTYARDSFLSFYSVAFLGYRGSIRHKVMVKTSHNATSYADQPTVSVTRSSGGYVEELIPIGARSIGTSTQITSYSASSIPSMVDFRAGGTVGYAHINPVLEYSTPFYSRGKFCWAQDRYPQRLKSTPDGGYDVPWHQIVVNLYSNVNNVSTRIDKFVAAGDDFSLFFYLYGPRMVLDQPTSWPQT